MYLLILFGVCSFCGFLIMFINWFFEIKYKNKHKQRIKKINDSECNSFAKHIDLSKEDDLYIKGLDKYTRPFYVGFFISVVFSICLFIIGTLAVSFAVQEKIGIRYANTLYEREVLEIRLENYENNIVGNELLYSDIVKFNNNLRNIKRKANNKWLNTFVNEDIATIDYIDISDYLKG